MFSLLWDRFKRISTAGIILIFLSGCVPPETDLSNQTVQPIMSSQAKAVEVYKALKKDNLQAIEPKTAVLPGKTISKLL